MASIIEKLIVNCRVPCCNGQHKIDRKKDRYKMDVLDFYILFRHSLKNISNICRALCKKDDQCNLHKKLQKLNFFVNYIEEKNMREKGAINKIYIKECSHPSCFGWCFSLNQ